MSHANTLEVNPPAVKRAKRVVNGVLLLDKPAGITSNAALQQAKRLFNAQKAGHTGTLDPFATGLLLLCFGEATKFSQYQLEADKHYLAVLQLGTTTTTGDPEGDILETCDVDVSPTKIEAVMMGFLGARMQIPPMYSALKYQGRPLYEYARAGITIPRLQRPVQIRRICVLQIEDEMVTFEVQCSAGTYIRTLAEDIGALLGCGAHLRRLTRLGSGGFSLQNTVSLAQLDEDSDENRLARLAAVDSLVAHLPTLQITADAARAVLRGQHPHLQDNQQTGFMRLYCRSEFVGLAEMDESANLIPRRLMQLDPMKF